MASIALEVASEEAVGFEAETEAEAGSKGLNLKDVASSFGSIIGLAASIDDLVRTLKSGTHDERQDRLKRRAVGIVLPSESRLKLVLEGILPPYYAGSSIRNILLHGKLPYGWSKDTAVNQGFARDIRHGEIRQQLQNESIRLLNALEFERNTRNTMNNFNRIANRLRTERRLEELKSKLV